MGEFLPFYCRGGNAKGDKTKGGRVHNMQAKPRKFKRIFIGNYSKKEDCLNGKHQKTLGKTQRDR